MYLWIKIVYIIPQYRVLLHILYLRIRPKADLIFFKAQSIFFFFKQFIVLSGSVIRPLIVRVNNNGCPL